VTGNTTPTKQQSVSQPPLSKEEVRTMIEKTVEKVKSEMQTH